MARFGQYVGEALHTIRTAPGYTFNEFLAPVFALAPSEGFFKKYFL